MALNRWQALYRYLIFRFPRAAEVWRRLVWWMREPRATTGMECVEPFPRWFGMTEEEEQWARGVIADYEAEQAQEAAYELAHPAGDFDRPPCPRCNSVGWFYNAASQAVFCDCAAAQDLRVREDLWR